MLALLNRTPQQRACRTLPQFRVARFLVLLPALITVACGPPATSIAPPPEAPEPTPDPQRRESTLDVYAELGVLDEAAVRSTFERVWKGPMTACQKNGGNMIFGNTVIRLRVNHSGGVKWTYFKETNLGDRSVEKCILNAVRSTRWPIPQGGEDGIAEQELPFADYSKRPPVSWPASRARSTVSKAAPALSDCRHVVSEVSGTFVATAIINGDGSVASVGIQQPDETADDVANCLVDVILSLVFPETGSWPAKVSFDVP